LETALLAVTGLSLFVPRILQRVIDDVLMKGQAGTLAQAAL
jgi:ABC-type bacteriocin/lantibiotic exporter with double-glycine peptidase domain